MGVSELVGGFGRLTKAPKATGASRMVDSALLLGRWLLLLSRGRGLLAGRCLGTVRYILAKVIIPWVGADVVDGIEWTVGTANELA